MTNVEQLRGEAMIEVVETDADHVVGIRVSGRVSENDIDRTIGLLEEKLRRHPAVSFAAEIDGLEGISPAALFKDIKYGMRQLAHLDRFHRVAVVTDKKWIRLGVKFEAKILPNVEVKSFRRKDREAAYSWVTDSAGA